MMVKRAVYSWSIRFRSAGYGPEQLAWLSDEYFDDLQSEYVTKAQFDAAARMVRKRCRFFPTMADVLEAVQEIRRNPQLMAPVSSDVAQIEEHTAKRDNLTPEEIARNQERLNYIKEMLAGKMSIDDAVAAVSGKSHIAEFGKLARRD